MSFKKYLSIAMLLSAMTTQANPTHVTIEQKDGNKIDFLLADAPTFTFSNGDLIVNGDASTSYAIGGVKNYHFSTCSTTDINSASADELSVVYIDASTIKIQNAETNAVVSLVDASSKVVLSAKTDSEGSAVVGLPQAKGVYVLSVADKSFKVIRK